MKKLLALVTLTLLVSITVVAQEKNEISLEVLQLTVKVANHGDIPICINYERVLSESWVLTVSPIIELATNNSISLWAEFDWHPSDKGLSGFFIGPAISLPIVFDKVNGTKLHIDIGGALGYQFLLSNSINIDLVLGVPIFDLTDSQNTNQTGSIRIARGLVMIGYRF